MPSFLQKRIAFPRVWRLGGVDTAVLCEKTALTGAVELYDLYAVDGDKLALLAAAAALEQGGTHPFAAALLRAAEQLELSLPMAEDALIACGRGISARIGEDVYFLGNRKWIAAAGVRIPHAIRAADLGGCSALYAARNGEFCGMFLFRETLFPNAAEKVSELRALGLHTVLLCSHKKEQLAKRLGVDRMESALLKKERQKVLHTLQKNAKIIVIEDLQQETVFSDLRLAKTLRGAARQNLAIVCGALLLCFLFFQVLPAFAVVVLLLAAMAVWFNFQRLRTSESQMYISSEETAMFGKVNYTMQINGMNCTHCSARVKTALESLRGVSADISLEEKLARIKCPASLDAEKLCAAVTEVGFTVVSIERV